MTDIQPSTPADPSRDVVRTEFNNESIWLPRLAVEHLNAGHAAISGKTFTDCLIEGPAALMPDTTVVFDSCNMGTTTEMASLLLAPVGERVTGAVAFSDCRFVRCRFLMVGFVGREAFREQLLAGVPVMTDEEKAR